MKISKDLKLKNFPDDTIQFVCELCERGGQYSKQHLIWRFGPDILVSELLHKIANCEENDACRAAILRD